MSGGSFDYLCYKEVPQLMENETTLLEMAEALKSSPEYVRKERAVAKFDAFCKDLVDSRERLRALWAELEPIAHAIEWHHSNDYGLDQVQVILDKFDKEPPHA